VIAPQDRNARWPVERDAELLASAGCSPRGCDGRRDP